MNTKWVVPGIHKYTLSFIATQDKIASSGPTRKLFSGSSTLSLCGQSLDRRYVQHRLWTGLRPTRWEQWKSQTHSSPCLYHKKKKIQAECKEFQDQVSEVYPKKCVLNCFIVWVVMLVFFCIFQFVSKNCVTEVRQYCQHDTPLKVTGGHELLKVDCSPALRRRKVAASFPRYEVLQMILQFIQWALVAAIQHILHVLQTLDTLWGCQSRRGALWRRWWRHNLCAVSLAWAR